MWSFWLVLVMYVPWLQRISSHDYMLTLPTHSGMNLSWCSSLSTREYRGSEPQDAAQFSLQTVYIQYLFAIRLYIILRTYYTFTSWPFAHTPLPMISIISQHLHCFRCKFVLLGLWPRTFFTFFSQVLSAHMALTFPYRRIGLLTCSQAFRSLFRPQWALV